MRRRQAEQAKEPNANMIRKLVLLALVRPPWPRRIAFLQFRLEHFVRFR